MALEIRNRTQCPRSDASILLRSIELTREGEGATVKRLRFAGCRQCGGSPFQRFEGCADRRLVVPLLGNLQPDMAERRVERRLVGGALGRCRQRGNRELDLPGLRLRESDDDLTFRTTGVNCPASPSS